MDDETHPEPQRGIHQPDLEPLPDGASLENGKENQTSVATKAFEAEEHTARVQLLKDEIRKFADILTQRVQYEASTDLVRIHCTLKGDKHHNNRVTTASIKVRFGKIDYSFLISTFERKFGQSLLLTFGCPVNENGHIATRRLLTAENMNDFWKGAHLVTRARIKVAPCHLLTFQLIAVNSQLNTRIALPIETKKYVAEMKAKDRLARTMPLLHQRLFTEAETKKSKVRALMERTYSSYSRDPSSQLPPPLPSSKIDAMLTRIYTADIERSRKLAAAERAIQTAPMAKCKVVDRGECDGYFERFYREGLVAHEQRQQKYFKKWGFAPRTVTLASLNTTPEKIVDRLYTEELKRAKERQVKLHQLHVEPFSVSPSPKLPKDVVEAIIQRLATKQE